MEYQLNLTKIFDAVFKCKWLILAAGVISLLLGFVLITGNAPDVYTASSSIYAASYASYQESVQGMNVMRDYVDVIRSRKVAERASGYLSQQVSSSEIMSAISARFTSDSNIITITAYSSDAELAIGIANAVADAFIQEIVSITTVESVKVLDSAYSANFVTDSKQEAMRLRVTIAAGAVAGAIILVAIVAVFDTRVAIPSEVTLGGKIELLGIIPSKKI